MQKHSGIKESSPLFPPLIQPGFSDFILCPLLLGLLCICVLLAGLPIQHGDNPFLHVFLHLLFRPPRAISSQSTTNYPPQLIEGLESNGFHPCSDAENGQGQDIESSEVESLQGLERCADIWFVVGGGGVELRDSSQTAAVERAASDEGRENKEG